jgi:hypothetical protein
MYTHQSISTTAARKGTALGNGGFAGSSRTGAEAFRFTSAVASAVTLLKSPYQGDMLNSSPEQLLDVALYFDASNAFPT